MTNRLARLLRAPDARMAVFFLAGIGLFGYGLERILPGLGYAGVGAYVLLLVTLKG